MIRATLQRLFSPLVQIVLRVDRNPYRFFDVTINDPRRRLEETFPVKDVLARYSSELAYATHDLVNGLIHPKDGIPEYRHIGRKPQKHGKDIERLTAFAAALLHRHFLTSHQNVFLYKNETDERDHAKAEDFSRVFTAMYGTIDPAVEQAAELSNALDNEKVRTPDEIAEAYYGLFSSLLGLHPLLPSTQSFMSHSAEARTRHIISALLAVGKKSVARLPTAFKTAHPKKDVAFAARLEELAAAELPGFRETYGLDYQDDDSILITIFYTSLIEYAGNIYKQHPKPGPIEQSYLQTIANYLESASTSQRDETINAVQLALLEDAPTRLAKNLKDFTRFLGPETLDSWNKWR